MAVSGIPQPAWLRQTTKTSALAQNSTGSDCDFTQPLSQNVDNLPRGWNKVSTRLNVSGCSYTVKILAEVGVFTKGPWVSLVPDIWYDNLIL